ncbi:hypothetical protein CLV58_12577 [Spirosoma oryzae]|uniref:Parallel beta helix pectate lyase-like protein n=2 Tax=Spirosoma oryzae TaxID=1469603 RepID=A0A2T0S8Q9_9BACT|nr:hypothetical protein CLV58_12577 [Spirosoma oryzae]
MATDTKIVSLSNTAALALSAANSATLTAANALTAAQARLLTTDFASWTTAQATTDQNQNTDIANRLLTTTYNNNRTTDQQATTNAQSTATNALTLGQTNTSSIASVSNTAANTGSVVTSGRLANTSGTNTGDQQIVLNGTQLYITGPTGTTVTLPSSSSSGASNFALSSASPWIPVTTGASSATIGDLLTSGLGLPIFNRTQATLQTYINGLANVTTSIPRLYLYGSYDFSAQANTPLTISKNMELIGANGATFDGGTTNGFLMLFNNINTRLLVENITFRSRATTSPYALVYANEQGDSRNVTFRNCRFSAPMGNYNAFGANTWNGSSGCFYDNWLLDNCVVDSVGRMGYEFLAHKNDGVIRIRNLTMNNCQANNVGLYNPANVSKASATINGMGVSLSGDLDGVQLKAFKSLNCLIGIESVSAKNVSITDPFITGTRSMTYLDGGVTTIIGATGFSLTDGGSTDGGLPGRSTSNVTITGGEVNVVGKGLGTYYADRVTITGTKFLAGAYMEVQHATRLNFNSFDYEMTGRNFIASFEDVKNSQIRNVRFSRENNTVTPIYQPINLDGNTAGNVFSNISIITNTAYNGGNPDNYYNDQQPFRLRYINEAGTNNSIRDIFLNGIKQPDYVIENIPTLAITAAGSYTALTHIARININPTSAIASLTLVLPTTSLDRKDVEVNFGGSINSGTVVTTLTINGPGGTTPVQSNTPGAASAGQVFTYRWDSTISRYRRIN